MGKIVVNKHFPDYKEITKDVFDAIHGKGEIVISNDVGLEGIYILNDAGNVVRINSGSGSLDPEQVREVILALLEDNYMTSNETKQLVNGLSGSVITLYEDVSVLSGTVKTILENSSEINEELVREIAKNEASMAVAEVVASADTSFDTLKEIADWIKNDTTGSAEMANDIEQLNKDVEKLQDDITIVSATTVNIPELIQNYLQEAIKTLNAAEHFALTKNQYNELIEKGSVEIFIDGKGKIIEYSDYAYYAIYEDEEDIVAYVLTFKNGEIVISSDNLLPGTLITYPIMEDYSDDTFTYEFKWKDNSYNGKEMPSYNVTVKGKYTAELSLKEDYTPEKPIIINGTDNVVLLNKHKITGPVFTESNGEVLEGNSDSYGFWVKEGAELTIDGNGEVVAQDAKYSMAVWANGGNVIIKGGIYRNSGDSCDLIYASAGGKVYIYDGEFIPAGPASGTVPGTKNPYTALNIKDNDRNISEIVVYGGRFHNFDPANNLSEGINTNFLAYGYKSVEVEPNVWEVMPITPNFEDDDIILYHDYTPSDTIVIENGVKNINLNNKSIIAPTFTDLSDNSSNSYGLWIKGGEVTIDGEGEIIAQNSDYSIAVWANGGKVIINNGTYRNSGESCDLIYASNNGHVEINGGVFFATPKGSQSGTGNDYSALNIKDSDRENSSILVKGGIFYGFNPANNLSEGINTNFVAEGYKSVEIEPNVWEVMPITEE